MSNVINIIGLVWFGFALLRHHNHPPSLSLSLSCQTKYQNPSPININGMCPISCTHTHTKSETHTLDLNLNRITFEYFICVPTLFANWIIIIAAFRSVLRRAETFGFQELYCHMQTHTVLLHLAYIMHAFVLFYRMAMVREHLFISERAPSSVQQHKHTQHSSFHSPGNIKFPVSHCICGLSRSLICSLCVYVCDKYVLCRQYNEHD